VGKGEGVKRRLPSWGFLKRRPGKVKDVSALSQSKFLGRVKRDIISPREGRTTKKDVKGHGEKCSPRGQRRESWTKSCTNVSDKQIRKLATGKGRGLLLPRGEGVQPLGGADDERVLHFLGRGRKKALFPWGKTKILQDRPSRGWAN